VGARAGYVNISSDIVNRSERSPILIAGAALGKTCGSFGPPGSRWAGGGVFSPAIPKLSTKPPPGLAIGQRCHRWRIGPQPRTEEVYQPVYLPELGFREGR
jgi:hypothetical protein